jgi:hypothetical protein
MSAYVDKVVSEHSFAGNAVVKINGVYFAARQPDSGLVIPYPYANILEDLNLNANSISPKNVTTAIASYTFKLTDKEGIISRLVKDTGADYIGQDVEIWLGRTGEAMAFADYYKLPTTKLSKINKKDAGYMFTTREATDRMNRPIYDKVVRLNGDIVAGTTTIIAKDSIDDFPSAGMFKLEEELISYTSKNNGTKTFSGCARGEFFTIPAAHDDNENIYVAEVVVDNPIDIILSILTSGGGGGAYDVLDDGLAIAASLIDITTIEELRDTLFDGVSFALALYNLPSALKYIEQQLLLPCNLRFAYSRGSKITLVKLDQAVFVSDLDIIDHDTLLAHPTLDIQDSNVVNKITIDFDYNEGTGKYAQTLVFEDAASIATYGKSTSPLKFQFKGTDDAVFVGAYGDALLARLANPYPEISVKTQIDKSLINAGDKTRLESVRLANEFGDLNFAADLEVISRQINWKAGDASFKLAYTSYTNYRLGYIAPSEAVAVITSQSIIEVAAGKGANWRAGWKVRLWDDTLDAYTADPVNEIASLTDDEITFVDAWATTLGTQHILKFADYDDATKEQRRYCFVSIDNQNFSRLGKQYSIVP